MITRSFGFAALAFAALMAGTGNPAQAQSSGMFGTNGAMSSTLGTASASSSSGSGLTAFPSSQFATSNFGASTGQSAVGQGGFGQTGLGQTATGMNGQGQVGQRAGLVGQGNAMLAGMNQAGQPATGQNMQNNRQPGQNRNNANRRGGQSQNQAGTAGASNQRSIRPRLVVAFDSPAPVATKMATTLATRFDKLSDRAGFENVTVEIDGKKVILRGEVASDATSRKAAMLARLEPGVRSVQNELVVKAPAPAPADE